MTWKFWITGVISTILIILGFVGNSIAMYILRKPKMRSAFNQLLIILCIIDSIFLLSNIPTTVMALGLSKFNVKYIIFQVLFQSIKPISEALLHKYNFQGYRIPIVCSLCIWYVPILYSSICWLYCNLLQVRDEKSTILCFTQVE